MAVYKRGRVWWYRFTWNGVPIRESTKQTNKRVAEQIEAAHKTSLAKGEVGIRERSPVPTVREFAERDFLPFAEAQFRDKPKTLAYYKTGLKKLMAYPTLANATLEAITPEEVSGFVAKQREAGFKTTSINRHLQVLRRILKLAAEWGKTEKALSRVRMLPGENRRERVLSIAEETAYLEAACAVGDGIVEDYRRALDGIRALDRGEAPTKPADPHLLCDMTTVLIDCALRPEECYRLRWEHVRDGALHVQHGKTTNARRAIPLAPRSAAILEMRRAAQRSGEWVFPTSTRSGHIEQSTLKKQHAKACALAGVAYFVPYTFRHTCLTRWAAHMDPYTLAYLAGHSDFGTTRRYVHPQAETVLAAMERAQGAEGGHKYGHTAEAMGLTGESRLTVIH
jgi:integrase